MRLIFQFFSKNQFSIVSLQNCQSLFDFGIKFVEIFLTEYRFSATNNMGSVNSLYCQYKESPTPWIVDTGSCLLNYFQETLCLNNAWSQRLSVC
jgi:hypothetical protein